MTFASDTAVRQIAPGRFAVEMHDRWASLVGVHGGYTAAIVARAIGATVDDDERALRSIAVQFAAPPQTGPAEVEVTVERSGQSMTTTSARLTQAGRLLQVTHAVSSRARSGMEYDDDVRPAAAVPGDTPIFVPRERIAHFQNAEVRLDPRTVPFSGGNVAHVAAWLRPLGGEAIDAAWLVAMCDLLPPAVFTRTTAPVRAASIEYVVHLATSEPQLPAGDHVYLSCRSALSRQGFAVEDATLWGPMGDVMAVARQTRLAGV